MLACYHAPPQSPFGICNSNTVCQSADAASVLSQLLEYQLASEERGSAEWRAHIAEVAKQNPGLSGKMVSSGWL